MRCHKKRKIDLAVLLFRCFCSQRGARCPEELSLSMAYPHSPHTSSFLFISLSISISIIALHVRLRREAHVRLRFGEALREA